MGGGKQHGGAGPERPIENQSSQEVKNGAAAKIQANGRTSESAKRDNRIRAQGRIVAVKRLSYRYAKLTFAVNDDSKLETAVNILNPSST
jgi:hypothetical protein